MDVNSDSSVENTNPQIRPSLFSRIVGFFVKIHAKNILFGFLGLSLLVGVGSSIFLSQNQTNTQQHASANYIPPDGMGLFDSCGATCLDHLDTFSQAGFKLVIDYSIFNTPTTLANLTAYAQRAQQDNIKIIWSLKDMWINTSNMGLYTELAKESGCSNKSCLASWIVSQVKDFPATWGYYTADEPTSGDYAAVSNLSGIIRKIDTVKPILIIKLDTLENGYAPNAAALTQFASIANVLGEDWYPVAYGAYYPVNISQTSAIANEVQYVVNSYSTYHRDSTMVLEVNAGNSKDGVHATTYPTESQMAEMLLLTLQHSQPRMVLWYWYPGTSSTQWNNLVTAIHTVLPQSNPIPPTNVAAEPTTIPPTAVPVEPTNSPSAAPVQTAPDSCVGARSGGGSDQYDDANGPYVNCVKVSNCNGTTCSVQLSWQEKNRATANEYKLVLYPVRPGKSGSYELLTFKNTTSTTLTGLKQGTSYGLKVSAWPNDVFRKGYGIPYYGFTASPDPTPTGVFNGEPIISPIPADNANSIPDSSGSPSDSTGDSGSASDSSGNGSIVGDINGDGTVDILDYNLLVGCYGKSIIGVCAGADLNNDGTIDGIDYNIFLRAMIGQ